MNEADLSEVKIKAVDYLARRDHSESELRTKLLKKGYAPDLVDQAICAMREADYLNETRYARMIIRNGYERGHGPQKLRFKMQQQSLDSGLINASFDEFDGDWYEKAASIRERKFGLGLRVEEYAKREDYYKERARQMRFLASRGFAMDHIEFALEDGAGDDEYSQY